MGRSTVCLIIAYISAVFHSVVVISSTIFMINMKRAANLYNPAPKYEHYPYYFRTGFDTPAKAPSLTTDLFVLAITFIISITLLILSLYLILGIKRERHEYMAPWVFSTAIAIVINVIKVIAHSKDQLCFNIIIIIIPIAIWYPVYSLYRELRDAPANSSHIVGARPYPTTQIPINPQTHPVATPASYYTPPNAGYYPPQAYPPQGYAQQAYPPQANPPQAYPPDVDPPPYSSVTDGNYNPPVNPYYTK